MAFDTTKRRSWLLPAGALSRDSMPSGIPDRRCVAVQGQLETLRCGCFSQQVQEQPHHTPPRGAEPTTAPSLLFPALPSPSFSFFFFPPLSPRCSTSGGAEEAGSGRANPRGFGQGKEMEAFAREQLTACREQAELAPAELW